MITKDNTISISHLRRNASEVFGKVENSDEPLYVFRRSNPQAVVLSVEYFNRIQKQLDEYLDILEIEGTKNDEKVTLSDYKENRWSKE